MEKKIVVTEAFKTKTGKCCLRGMVLDDVKETMYKKGLISLECWYDDIQMYEQLDVSLIGQPILAKLEYESRGFDNKAVLMIKSIG